MVFTVCWLAFQAFIMHTVGTAVQEQSGPVAGFLAWVVAGIVLVFAYTAIVWASAAGMEKYRTRATRDRHIEDDT
ncbi:hypothetical protein [Acrocarpospora sp. B8E8]|uniref:hypothetical protein n=1 Tax=Acrocarpospora sp. B8E8 TaxID=3153572 RepID=UPI00325E7CF5